MLDLGDPSLYAHLQAPAPTATSPKEVPPNLLGSIDFGTDSISATLVDADRYSTNKGSLTIQTVGGIEIVEDDSVPPGQIQVQPVDNPNAYTIDDLKNMRYKKYSRLYPDNWLDEMQKVLIDSLKTPIDQDVITGAAYGSPDPKPGNNPLTDTSRWSILGTMAESGIQMTARTWLQNEIRQWADSGDMYASIPAPDAPIMTPIRPQYPRDRTTRWTAMSTFSRRINAFWKSILKELSDAWDQCMASSRPGELEALTLSRYSTPAKMLPFERPAVPNMLPVTPNDPTDPSIWFPEDHPLRSLVVE